MKIKDKKFLRESKKLLTLITAVSMITSCSVSEKGVRKDSNSYHVSLMSYENDLRNYLKSKGVITDILNDGTIYVKEFTSKGTTNKIVYSYQEFREYLKYDEITFDDVRKVISENEYICEYFEIWLLDYLKEMEIKRPDIDLVVFYYNVKNLKISEISKEEMNSIGFNAIARFDARYQVIKYVDNISKDTFLHEVSHMFTDAYYKFDDKTMIHKTMALAVPVVQDNSIRISYLYNGILEGSNELFTSLFNERKGVSGYKDFVEDVKYYLELLDMDVCDMEEEGIVNFTNELINMGVNTSIEFSSMDKDFNSLLNNKKLVRK